ncbi:MAG: hypothetical protein ACM3ZT_08690 [Bacillota bacterium]
MPCTGRLTSLVVSVAASGFLLPSPAALAAKHNGASLDGQMFYCKADVSGPDKRVHHYDATVEFDGGNAMVAFGGLRWGIVLIDSDVDDMGDIEGYFIDDDDTHYFLTLDCSGASS